jgi:hypothetical protein
VNFPTYCKVNCRFRSIADSDSEAKAADRPSLRTTGMIDGEDESVDEEDPGGTAADAWPQVDQANQRADCPMALSRRDSAIKSDIKGQAALRFTLVSASDVNFLSAAFSSSRFF